MTVVPIDVCQQACDRRDPAFDGVFYVAIRSTRIYCRPICPSRQARHDNRVFFESRTAAERGGFRPCRRCRPELAHGDGPLEAVDRTARHAMERIAAGALDGHSVRELAADLGLSERHLRRALGQKLGASPLDLALLQRLRTAQRLLVETSMAVTQIAFTSGFQSLRRFNAAFRERFDMSPRELRGRERALRQAGAGAGVAGTRTQPRNPGAQRPIGVAMNGTTFPLA